MNVNANGTDIILTNVCDFRLRHIFECGQCFRFNRTNDDTYFGIFKNRALSISQNGDTVILHDTSRTDFYEVWHDFFDLDTDYGEIKRHLGVDETMRQAVEYGSGIRILRQDLWETTVSFIISASNNIPRIKGIIERLCEHFGEPFEYAGKIYHAFPSPDALASLSERDLAPIRAGFRDKYILDAARKFFSGELSPRTLSSASYEEARALLKSINGVGDKVAGCILLFGLARREAFPVDVWIKRVMEYFYFGSPQPIPVISEFAKTKFSGLGGYAQQYLFLWARDNKIGATED